MIAWVILEQTLHSADNCQMVLGAFLERLDTALLREKGPVGVGVFGDGSDAVMTMLVMVTDAVVVIAVEACVVADPIKTQDPDPSPYVAPQE